MQRTNQATKPSPPKTSAEIIAGFGNMLEAAAKLGVPIGVVAEMSTDGIPHLFRQLAIDTAAKLGIPGVTPALLEATYKKPETPKAIIIAFGGRVAVAKILGTSKNAVSNWYLSGVPSKYHRRLAEAAERLRVPGITVELLESTHHPTPARGRRVVRRRCENCGCTIVEATQSQPA